MHSPSTCVQYGFVDNGAAKRVTYKKEIPLKRNLYIVKKHIYSTPVPEELEGWCTACFWQRFGFSNSGNEAGHYLKALLLELRFLPSH